MKLVMYSSNIGEESPILDEILLHLIGKKNPRFTYIPECSFFSRDDYIKFVYKFKQYGIKKYFYFPIDFEVNKYTSKVAFEADCIHLAGGNTFHFLSNLRKNLLLNNLKEFVSSNRVLCGTSAGSILMTPDISMAGYPPFDCDDNDIKLKKLNSLNLVNFYFFPHFKTSNRYFNAIREFSKQIKFPIYACCDYSGLIIEDRNITTVGKVYYFKNGDYHLINS